MSEPNRDPSVEYEPHLQGAAPAGDPSEARAASRLRQERSRETDDQRVEHSVWDEPTTESIIAGTAAEDQLTYSRWLEQKISETSRLKSWCVVLAIVLASGPWGVLGVLADGLFRGERGLFSLVSLTIIGPVTEEIMKIAIALWVVEKCPYLFKSIIQVLFCAAAGGLAFALIENLIYLNVYFPDMNENLSAWRWTICTGLHINCSVVAGIGLARIWDNAIRNLRRPELGLGMPWFFTAMVGHGLYNFGTFVAESSGWLSF